MKSLLLILILLGACSPRRAYVDEATTLPETQPVFTPATQCDQQNFCPYPRVQDTTQCPSGFYPRAQLTPASLSKTPIPTSYQCWLVVMTPDRCPSPFIFDEFSGICFAEGV